MSNKIKILENKLAPIEVPIVKPPKKNSHSQIYQPSENLNTENKQLLNHEVEIDCITSEQIDEQDTCTPVDPSQGSLGNSVFPNSKLGVNSGYCQTTYEPNTFDSIVCPIPDSLKNRAFQLIQIPSRDPTCTENSPISNCQLENLQPLDVQGEPFFPNQDPKANLKLVFEPDIPVPCLPEFKFLDNSSIEIFGETFNTLNQEILEYCLILNNG